MRECSVRCELPVADVACAAENLDEMGIFVSLAGTGKTYMFSNSVLLHLVYAMLTYKQKIDLHSTVAGL